VVYTPAVVDCERARRIKSIVERNFDLSPLHTSRFEERYGLFACLAGRLLSLAGCVLGCTGDSTLVIASLAGPAGLVLGLDISGAMLRAAVARTLAPGSAPVHWIRCDAESPALLEAGAFDAVLYNACAFLLPDAEASFARAARLVAPGGRVGMTVLQGLRDARTGEDLVARAAEDGRLGVRRGSIVDPASLVAALERSVGPVTTGIETRSRPGEARAFFAIPAQSASIFPGRDPAERPGLVEAFFDDLEGRGIPVALEWEVSVATRGGG
jgi:SAM-dependent methyltransferase